MPNGPVIGKGVNGGLNPRINGDPQNLGAVFAVNPW
jgi:hypothetical protein